MRRRCLSADELAAFVRGCGRGDDERHVRACGRCTARVTLIRRIVKAGLEGIAAATADVDDLVQEFTAARPATWWQLIREPRFQREDFARRLVALAIDARGRDANAAIDLAKAAATVADACPESRRGGRFETWKLVSSLLREAGRYAETETALSKADAAVRSTPNPEVAAASMCLARALYYAEPDVWRPDEARQLLDDAERVFTQHQPARLQALRTARAFLLFRSGALTAARADFGSVLAMTPPADRQAYLIALVNFTATRVELGECDAALKQDLAILLKENHALSRTVEVARARWLVGRTMLRGGRYSAAATRFIQAMEGIGDEDAAVRAGVDAVEALLLADRTAEAFALAQKLATVAAALDRREPSRRRRLTAQVMAYLREAAQRSALTPDLVADLARYLDRIMRQRPVDFVPPMPLTAM